jgi:uncharacterized tellurite resistance protein B-like protein
MGLLSRFLGSEPARKPADDVLLMQGMMLMMAADGSIDDEELATLAGFASCLPEFRGKDIRDVLRSASQNLKRAKNEAERVQALAGISSENIRKKLFVLAVDLAMSSGDVDESEDRLLDAMKQILKISDDVANKTIEVMAIKYAK